MWHWLRQKARQVRGVLATIAILAFSVNGLWAQVSAPQSTASEPEFLKWALTQGGLVIVVLIIGWSYRRDLVWVAKQEEEKAKILTDLVEKSTAAMTKASESIARCPFSEHRS